MSNFYLLDARNQFVVKRDCEMKLSLNEQNKNLDSDQIEYECNP